MSTETPRGILEDPNPNAEQFIAEAEAYHGELVIRLTEARGSTVDVVAVPEVDEDLWVACRKESAAKPVSNSWLCETPYVRSMIRGCQPDVELIDEPVSLFRKS